MHHEDPLPRASGLAADSPFAPSALPPLTLDAFLDPHAMRVTRRVLDAMPVMMAVIDTNQQYLYANERYVRAVNSSQPTWEGLTVREYLPSYLHEFVSPRLSQAARGERACDYLDIVPADGIPRTVLVNCEPLPSADGKTELFMMTGIDATDLWREQQHLSLAQKLETIGRLTGGIAHDFNNQLAIMVGALALLSRDMPSSTSQRLIDICKKAAAGCTKLTSQLLTYGGRQALQPRAMRVTDHLQSSIERARVSIPDNITFNVDADEAGYTISVDPTLMEIALVNLIFNARDALPEGGTITIGVSPASMRDDVFAKTTSDAGNFVCIELADDGVGMDPETARRAFEPFFTTKRRSDGAGMGLAMVYGFVKQSGGHVELITAPSQGTTMRIYLPRAERAEQLKRSATPTNPAPGVRLCILVVEDDPMTCEVICERLRALGHATRSCDSAEKALQIMAGNKIDIVLTDILIRGLLDGWQLRDLVRMRYPHVRVLCTSWQPDPRAADAPELAPGTDFLPKPINFETLAAMLGSAAPRQPGS